MVREARKERTAGESLKRAESIRKGGNCERNNLISRNQKRAKGRKPRRKREGLIQATGGGRF